MPNDLPSWSAVYQQSQRRLAAGVFEALTQDLRALLRVAGKLAAAVQEATGDSVELMQLRRQAPARVTIAVP